MNILQVSQDLLLASFNGTANDFIAEIKGLISSSYQSGYSLGYKEGRTQGKTEGPIPECDKTLLNSLMNKISSLREELRDVTQMLMVNPTEDYEPVKSTPTSDHRMPLFTFAEEVANQVEKSS